MMSVDELKAWKFEKSKDSKIFDDESKMCIVDNDKMFDEKVFNSSKFKKKDSMHKMFKHLPGETKLVDKIILKRINDQKNLNMFGDKDKDKVLNIFDSNPRNKNKQGLQQPKMGPVPIMTNKYFTNKNKKIKTWI